MIGWDVVLAVVNAEPGGRSLLHVLQGLRHSASEAVYACKAIHGVRNIRMLPPVCALVYASGFLNQLNRAVKTALYFVHQSNAAYT